MLNWTKTDPSPLPVSVNAKRTSRALTAVLLSLCCQRYILRNVALIVAAEPDLLDSCQTVFPMWLVDNGHLFIKYIVGKQMYPFILGKITKKAKRNVHYLFIYLLVCTSQWNLC